MSVDTWQGRVEGTFPRAIREEAPQIGWARNARPTAKEKEWGGAGKLS